MSPIRKDRKPLIEALREDVLVLDGAMGTALYSRGLSFQDCFDAANLEHPDWVLEVHRSHREAGAQGITTNTFGANRFRLSRHRREDELERILRAGGELARQAAGGAYVLGSLGPLGVEIEPLGRIERAEARAAFAEAAAVLHPLVDGFALETFSNLDELLEALAGVRSASDKPVLAFVTVDGQGVTLHGTPAAACAVRLDAAGADVIGLNCSTGPRVMVDVAPRLAAATRRPLAARPNAGMPRQVDGRLFYESSPDAFARFARRFLQAGGRVLGGCCGTTAEHVRALVRAARAIGSQVRAEAPPPAAPLAQPPRRRQSLPLAQRSRLGRELAAGALVTSVELVPPRTPDLLPVLEAARRLRDGGATVINIPDGPRASARVSNLAVAVTLARTLDVEPLLHFCCRDRNLLGMQSDLMGAAALNLHDLLVVTGDPPYVGNYPNVTAVFDVDSIGLCNIVANLNQGLDLGGNELGAQTRFCFGAAFNPTALEPERELRRLQWKIAAGVDFIITQPLFDAEHLLALRPRLAQPHPPILAGIWPLRSLRNAEFLATEVPGVRVPDAVLERMRAADRRGTAAAEGVAIAVETVAALAGRVHGFQIAAPGNQVEPALAVLAAAQAAGGVAA